MDHSPEGSGQVFAFVHRLESKPNERMERFLAEQGVFPAQATTFLSDGGETLRQAQGEFWEFGEPILDWFHVAMRATQLSQSIKCLAADTSSEEHSVGHIDECLRSLCRAKAYLWHGSPHCALRTLDDLTWDIGTESVRSAALQEKLEEFMNYITTNVAVIPNYADRHRHGEPIATAFVESAVNQVVSKRFVKMQQMRWTPRGSFRSGSGPGCSISSCEVHSNVGIRSYGPAPTPSAWQRSTRNGPLSYHQR
jgi:hypothetical protein